MLRHEASKAAACPRCFVPQHDKINSRTAPPSKLFNRLHRVGHLAHFPAGFGTAAASLGALAAVVHVLSVLFTLGSARFADVGAQLAHVGGVGTVAGHEGHSHVANFGAVAVEANAPDHHLHVLLAEAGVGAVVASHGAGLAGFNTVLIRLVCHVRIWFGTATLVKNSFRSVERGNLDFLKIN